MDPKPRQSIRYLRTSDGVRLAWASVGSGPALVKASNWLTHLEYEWDSPLWRHWIRFFAAHFHFVRYDERGCGMTDWDVGELSTGRWTDDLAAVIEAAGMEDRVALLGISQGSLAAISYAVRHPERVSHLILYGAYAQGAVRRSDEAGARRYRAMVELARGGWGSDNPTFRQVFTSRFIPGGSAEQLSWFNDLCLKTASPENAVRLLEARAGVDVSELLPRVRVPTLVLHSRDDQVVPLAQAHLLAAAIPGAEFVELDSRNHILLESEPAWERFCGAVLDFTGASASSTGSGAAFASLSPREREILALLTAGLANAQIAGRLGISDKTVRNHISKVFDKLGVWSRAQAIVFARDHGFGSG